MKSRFAVVFTFVAVGCAFPVDEFQPPASTQQPSTVPTTTTTPSTTTKPCDDLPSPKRVVGTSCYWIASGGKQSGRSAETACTGGHLVTVSAAEQPTVQALVLEAGDVWIGLRETGGAFGWITGEPEPFRNWRDDYPKGDDADCVVAKKDGWENKKCSDAFLVLCER